MSIEIANTDFLPNYESARIAVERARQIVKENNEIILKIKSESNISDLNLDYDFSTEAEHFSHEDTHVFDLYKIKSKNGIKDFFKDVFGVH